MYILPPHKPSKTRNLLRVSHHTEQQIEKTSKSVKIQRKISRGKKEVILFSSPWLKFRQLLFTTARGEIFPSKSKIARVKLGIL